MKKKLVMSVLLSVCSVVYGAAPEQEAKKQRVQDACAQIACSFEAKSDFNGVFSCALTEMEGVPVMQYIEEGVVTPVEVISWSTALIEGQANIDPAARILYLLNCQRDGMNSAYAQCGSSAVIAQQFVGRELPTEENIARLSRMFLREKSQRERCALIDQMEMQKDSALLALLELCPGAVRAIEEAQRKATAAESRAAARESDCSLL